MEKNKLLRSMGCFNWQAGNVKHPLFAEKGFFDPEDKVQVKYEMLRAVHVEGMRVKKASEEFGFSRETYYKAERDFWQEGTVGLMEKEQGRRQPEKLVQEVVKYITTERKKAPDNNSGEVLAEKVWKRFKIRVHARTIYKVLKKTALV